ncbi:MAG: bifunctional diaminohydroxyphosphoribosylaminopyrimidine deaminase/5-amino-6-(5-phosphoribosylamino)uracil reductase RibD [Gammaproteobacteria bacterium]|nr:bifunctional diaminohydroxyphosphoribosylaminopyrimidine deaminase/5-amino-6-(5-phosphoribosylamino)uracil reductase RibD [Gammaproteobacteria bacterium]
MLNHRKFLLRCIELASIRSGFCAPNPAVGCVLVKNNEIISEGYHFGCGYAHAEVDALNKLNDESSDATLYVSLEPCCHYGRTPPCTERIKKAGIKNVFFGLKDPNSIVAGKGQAQLIQSGIPCELVELPEINEFYRAYSYWTNTKMPFVTAKLAMSKDHKIALENKKPVRISGEECSQLTHQYRQESDAILTTVETVINDDPKLNVRLNDSEISKNIYILDSQCRLPLNAKIFYTAKKITVLHSENATTSQIVALEKKGAQCILIPNNNFGLDLRKCLEKIGLDGLYHLWVEIGAKCFNSFLEQRLLNQIIFYISPNKLGEKATPANIDLNNLLKTAVSVRESTFGEDSVYFVDTVGAIKCVV